MMKETEPPSALRRYAQSAILILILLAIGGLFYLGLIYGLAQQQQQGGAIPPEERDVDVPRIERTWVVTYPEENGDAEIENRKPEMEIKESRPENGE